MRNALEIAAADVSTGRRIRTDPRKQDSDGKAATDPCDVETDAEPVC